MRRVPASFGCGVGSVGGREARGGSGWWFACPPRQECGGEFHVFMFFPSSCVVREPRAPAVAPLGPKLLPNHVLRSGGQ